MSPVELPCHKHELRIEHNEAMLEDQRGVLKDIRNNDLKHILARLTNLDVVTTLMRNDLWWLKWTVLAAATGVLVLLGIKADLRW